MQPMCKPLPPVINIVFLSIFVIEMAIKMAGLGPIGYFTSWLNLFDAATVIIGIIELSFSGSSSVTAIRCLRLARLARISRAWKSMNDMINSLALAMPSVGYFAILVMLYLYMSAVVGMSFFGGRFDTQHGLETNPRANFDNFGTASLTVFQILTGENWNEVLYNGVKTTNYAAVLYFLVVFMIGDIVILNLFLAVILQFFDDGDPELSIKDARKTLRGICCPVQCFGEDDLEDEATMGTVSAGDIVNKKERRRRKIAAKVTTSLAPHRITSAQMLTTSAAECDEGSIEMELQSPKSPRRYAAGSPREARQDMRSPTSETEIEIVDMSVSRMIHDRRRAKVVKSASKPWHYWCFPTKTAADLGVGTGGRKLPDHTSLFCLASDNKFRRACALFIRQPWVENLVMFMIVVSSVVLVFDLSPDRQDSGWGDRVLWGFDIGFVCFFGLEASLKIIAQGFILHRRAYLRSVWNWLDFIVVITSIVSVVLADQDLEVVRVLRIFRTLRPLRTVKRSPSLRVVVEATILCLPSFINVLLLTVFVNLVFAIIAVQLFAGKFWRCVDSDGVTVCVSWHSSYCTNASGNNIYNAETCVAFGGYWKNEQQNFDNIGNAMLTLFEVASLEMWLEPLYASMDLPNTIGQQPIRNQSAWWAIYFVIFIVIGSFLVINIFVGAVVDNFEKAKLNAKGALMLTEDQQKFVESMHVLLSFKPESFPHPPEYDAWMVHTRTLCYRLITWDFDGTGKGKMFDLAIMCAIYVNVLVMAMTVWNPPSSGSYVSPGSDNADSLVDSDWNVSLNYINMGFTWLFFLEMVIKMLGLGLGQYFDNNWNVFDFILVVLSTLGFFLEIFLSQGMPLSPQLLRVVRSIRSFRLIRTLRRARSITRLLDTLVTALPAVGNVIMLLSLTIFIYALLGMAIFGHIKVDSGPYQALNSHANFHTFNVAVVTLFRFTTGESWNAVMHDCMDQTSPAAFLYFVTFEIFCGYLVLNLVVAIVLNRFQKVHIRLDCTERWAGD